MNNYVSTEKSLKRWLKTRVKVTMATVVGFLIAGTVAFGAGTIPEDGVYNNDVLLNTLQSTKFAVGQNGNLEIYSNGSVGHLLSDLQGNHSLSGIQNALSQQNNHPGYVVLTGALAGEGNYDGLTVAALNVLSGKGGSLGNLAKALKRFDTSNKTGNIEIVGDTKTIVGNTENSPVVLGLIGGDFSAGLLGTVEQSLTRTGNTSVTINNGNVFGATVGSTAISAGNLKVKYSFLPISANNKGTATINGNTTLNINGPANAAGITAGGLAAAIGGTATSTVNGDSNIKVNSVVNAGKLEGLTVGLFGGGMTVSTLGGKAEANTTGTTNVEITDGLSVGVIGGGLAVSTDASQYLKDGLEIGGKKGRIDGKGNFVIDLDGIPPITVSGLKAGGTSTVKSGDINVNLNGKTAAAAVLGNGIAVSHQNAPQGAKPTENDKISTSTVEANNITVNIDLTKNLNGTEIGNNNVIGKVKDVFVQLKNIVDPKVGTDVSKVIGSMQGAVGALKDGGIAVGVAGNGIAIAADKGVSTVKANNTTLNLNGGYIVGALGNGIAMNNAWAKSTAEVGKSVINIDGEDTEVIGVSGNGLAVYYGSGNYDGSLNFEGKALVQVKDSEINITNGSADGVFGGGIAIDDSELNTKNAEAITSGTSTIKVTGGLVKDFGYEHLGGVISGGTIGGQDYASYYKEVQALGDGVAIVGGGVAAGNNAKAHVENSIIEISGGKIEGDILAGGLATRGAESTVKESTINITGGEIIGSVYGTGKATEAGKGKLTEAGKATVENSVLNIDGYTNSIKNISGFDKITISKATDMKVNNILLEEGEILTNDGKLTLGLDKDNASLITIKGGTAENNGTIVVKSTQKVVSNTDGKFESAGTIQISDIEKDKLGEFKASDLFDGKYTFTGMLKDKNGNGILTTDDIITGGGDYNSDEINNAGKENNGEVNLGDKVALVGGEKPIDVGSVNIYNDITVKNNEEEKGVTIENTPINISGDKHITIGEETIKADLTIKDGTVNGEEGKTAVDFANKDSSLTLDGTNFTGNIGTENNTNGTVSVTDSTVDGDITAGSVVTGDEDLWNSLFGSTRLRTALFAATAKEVKTTVYNGNVTASDKLGVINENAIYNGKVTFTGNDGDGINIGATAGNTASARFNGDIKSNNIRLVGDATAYYASNITMTGKDNDTTGTKINGGTNIFEVSEKGENALLNTSNKVGNAGTGVSIADNSGVKLEANIDKDTVIDLGDKTNLNNNDVKLTENSDGFYELSKVGTEGNKYALNYKDNIASENGYSAELNDVFAASQVIHSKLNEFGYKTVDERAEVLDKYYSSNIYSETVKAAYDTVKMNEEAVLSLARKSEVGKWTAEGKALYSKDEYDRKGTVGDYSSEIESTGLMAAFGYGLNETTTAGVAFSGVKQDVDTDTGSADADLFYLGVYGNKVYGNYDFTAGLGYQFGEYEADNNILGTTGDKYDSKALSGYVQGRYTADLGDGLSLQPRVRLGYTYVEQDDTRDSYFGVSDAEISTFDAEFGLDTVKSVQLEKSKVDVKFGVSYVRTMGDTDDEFTGRFYGATASEGFNVLGAELAENVVKFNLGAEVTNENGFFYNGGLTYEFGSNDTEAYGVTAGVGYKF
ncbi:autotransporter outer membrane beta-barrel domain-containing protein [Fusobacterium perfoetens]|uniref:autotransporter domain-containing protein n=1 Tax=Fusobacterium perfoetens TaxID=852 RepID=UPI001F2AC25B|nr:autotransporter outer membrane beta-barrel domain-containing protein [Fusobacterium perfoetens]MCF2624846.1 autotransporter outer membrane beta-barrel domain-containing protein [Fusobacterium perfoetens]